ncbi:hypothetical protein SRABI05_01169 [Agrobacterium fabrum]|nr:hypothetical protein SRABI46_00271 [Agrobacterium fabrum]CAH0177325.1 hypothetical protein SRABI05_01169 [Agrobacterium fabrum]
MSYMYALFVNIYDNLYYMFGRKIKGICVERDMTPLLEECVLASEGQLHLWKEEAYEQRLPSQGNP